MTREQPANAQRTVRGSIAWRLAACLAILAMVAVFPPAMATAARDKIKVRNVEGTIAETPEGTASLRVVYKLTGKRHHRQWKPIEMTTFTFEHIPITCDDGNHLVKLEAHFGMYPLHLKRGRFERDYSSPGALLGMVKKNFRGASGQVVFGPNAAMLGWGGCSTGGPLEWTAQVVR